MDKEEETIDVKENIHLMNELAASIKQTTSRLKHKIGKIEEKEIDSVVYNDDIETLKNDYERFIKVYKKAFDEYDVVYLENTLLDVTDQDGEKIDLQDLLEFFEKCIPLEILLASNNER